MAGPKTTELLLVLKEIIELLEFQQENYWLAWISKCRNEIENSDFHGIERLLSAYGGMGSFSDLMFQPTETTTSQEYGASNDQLHSLRSKAYNLADEIKRDFNTNAG